MTGVADGEGCLARGGDTGDLHIAYLYRPANLPLGHDDYGRVFCRTTASAHRMSREPTRPRKPGRRLRAPSLGCAIRGCVAHPVSKDGPWRGGDENPSAGLVPGIHVLTP